jgi:hypothetical protein
VLCPPRIPLLLTFGFQSSADFSCGIRWQCKSVRYSVRSHEAKYHSLTKSVQLDGIFGDGLGDNRLWSWLSQFFCHPAQSARNLLSDSNFRHEGKAATIADLHYKIDVPRLCVHLPISYT